MKLILTTVLFIIIFTCLAFSNNWQFITSQRNSDGIEASYFIGIDESSDINGIKGYREKIVYTRGEYLEKIGIIEKFGYFDCANRNFVEKKISFEDVNGKLLSSYKFNEDDYLWKPVRPGFREMMLKFVCNY